MSVTWGSMESECAGCGKQPQRCTCGRVNKPALVGMVACAISGLLSGIGLWFLYLGAHKLLEWAGVVW